MDHTFQICTVLLFFVTFLFMQASVLLFTQHFDISFSSKNIQKYITLNSSLCNKSILFHTVKFYKYTANNYFNHTHNFNFYKCITYNYFLASIFILTCFALIFNNSGGASVQLQHLLWQQLEAGLHYSYQPCGHKSVWVKLFFKNSSHKGVNKYHKTSTCCK